MQCEVKGCQKYGDEAVVLMHSDDFDNDCTVCGGTDDWRLCKDHRNTFDTVIGVLVEHPDLLDELLQRAKEIINDE